MSITKKNLSDNVAMASSISKKDANKFLEFFISQIKNKTKKGNVKLSNFGVFNYKQTPERIGRNPKTKESYIIKSQRKLKFRPSCKLKKQIN